MDSRKLLAIYIRALRACNERRRRLGVTQFAFTILGRHYGKQKAKTDTEQRKADPSVAPATS